MMANLQKRCASRNIPLILFHSQNEHGEHLTEEQIIWTLKIFRDSGAVAVILISKEDEPSDIIVQGTGLEFPVVCRRFIICVTLVDADIYESWPVAIF